MPRSKRAKVVHLSKVEKKGKELTLKTFANVQECALKYPYLFIFAVDNMRNQMLKDVRVQLNDSRYVSKTVPNDRTAPVLSNNHLSCYPNTRCPRRLPLSTNDASS